MGVGWTRIEAIAGRAASVVLALCVLGWCGRAEAQPERFLLDVSPTTGTVEDTFVVTVRVEVAGVNGPDRFWDPVSRDFTLVDTQSKQSTSMRYDSGAGQRLMTSQLRRYFFTPKRAGKLRLGPARMRLDGEEYETRSIVVTVKPGTGRATAPQRPSDPDPTAAGGVGVPGFIAPDPRTRADMFIHAVIDRDNVFVGEQVIVTWLLYTRTEVLKFEAKPPRLEGLWSETLYEPDSYFTYHDTTVGRNSYVATVVSKRALFPTEPGRLQVSPYEARVASLNTPLGRPKRLRSSALFVDVKPLPEGAPPGFDKSYVGEFEIEATADRTDIEASESLTLKLSVTAKRGAIRRTRPPRLAFPGFTFREPRDYDDKVTNKGDVVGGERVYSYWTTPRQGGQQAIPAIELPYFDPKSGRYEVARTKPIAVMVRGDPGALEEAEAANSRENVIDRDIRLIREGGPLESRIPPRMYTSLWFWLFALVPPVGFLLVVLSDRLRQRLKKETPRSRLRRARGRARQRFRVAEIHIRGNRPAKFFGELAHVLYDYLEERVGQPMQSLTRDEMRDFLYTRGFSNSTIRAIDESLESFDFARFAPSAAGPEEMREALAKLKGILQAIERTQIAVVEEEEEQVA